MYLILYVYDILIKSSSKNEIKKLKEKLNGEFEMKDLGPTKTVHGIDIMRNHDKGECFLSHLSYLKNVVENFRMSNFKTVSTLFGQHTKLFINQYPQFEDENKMIESTPYASGV